MARPQKDSVVKLNMPCQPEFLRLMRLIIAGYASRWNVPFDEVEYIKVAVSEACNNALKCAQADNGDVIAITCWHQRGRIGFEIRSKGKGFARREKAGRPGIPPEEEMELGLLLIRSLMEDVKVTSDPQKGMRVVMFKSLGGPDKGQDAAKEKAKASS